MASSAPAGTRPAQNPTVAVRPRLQPSALAVAYAVTAALWLLFSDRLLLLFGAGTATLAAWQPAKAWILLAVTSVLLALAYGWLARTHRRAEEAGQAQLQQLGETLQRTLDQQQVILDNAPMLFYLRNLAGRYVLVNRQWEQYMGIGRERAVGALPADLFPADLASSLMDEQQRLLAENRPLVEETCFTQEGRSYTFVHAFFSLQDRNGQVYAVAGVLADITERKAMEESLRQSEARLERLVAERTAALRDTEERFARIFYASPYAIGYGGIRDGVLVDVNEGFAQFFGYTRAELIGKSALAFDAWISDEDWRGIQQGLLDHGALADIEMQFRRRDGEIRDVLLSVYRLTFTEGDVAIFMFADITERKQAEAHIRALNQALEARVAERTAHLEQEIAERARAEAEVKQLNQALEVQAQYLAEVNQELETFTYSVSHDLKAPLRGIDGYSRLLLEDYAGKLDEDGRFFLTTIRSATVQMAQLIDDLLAYSRLERHRLAPGQVDVRSLVNALAAQLCNEHAYPSTVVEVEIDPACATVEADPDALTVALRNLLDNALKFSAHTPAPKVAVNGQRTAQGCILCIRDNGVGFDMQYHNRIFEIFQRLHRAEDYQGTGVGLAIVRKAVQRMGGQVWAESTPGEGSTFYLEIPA